MMPLVKTNPSNPGCRAERGYILLMLLLTVALLTIAALAAAPSIAFTIKRDREEELIHRGVQYYRAIRLYAKKNGAYPLTLDQMYKDNERRTLRKIYKDPITGGDFKLLHASDIPAYGSSNVGGEASSSADADGTNSEAANPAAADGNPSPVADSDGNSPVAGAQGIILGVASKSKAVTIREFEHKNHYNQWLFFYDSSNELRYEPKGPTPTTLPPVQTQSPAAPNPEQPKPGGEPQSQ